MKEEAISEGLDTISIRNLPVVKEFYKQDG
jgi:hypothetical protein